MCSPAGCFYQHSTLSTKTSCEEISRHQNELPLVVTELIPARNAAVCKAVILGKLSLKSRSSKLLCWYLPVEGYWEKKKGENKSAFIHEGTKKLKELMAGSAVLSWNNSLLVPQSRSQVLCDSCKIMNGLSIA